LINKPNEEEINKYKSENDWKRSSSPVSSQLEAGLIHFLPQLKSKLGSWGYGFVVECVHSKHGVVSIFKPAKTEKDSEIPQYLNRFKNR
jgi:hypothetical protein